MKLKHILSAIKYLNQCEDNKIITFYSEGKHNWPFFESLILKLLKNKFKISYLSSTNDDPAFSLKNKSLFCFNIGKGYSRNWLFQNLKTKIMVMTVPGLETTQIKRSKYKVHYIYLQHSLASLHGIYPKGSFDHFDSVFCSTPYQLKEINKIKKIYSLNKLNVVKHGYPRVELLMQKNKNKQKVLKIKNILIAPSWGNHCVIETRKIFEILDKLLNENYNITLRPHPETVKLSGYILDEIIEKYNLFKNFDYENDINKSNSIINSDILITDWSGIAFEYYLIHKKPIIFLDLKQKINNEDYELFDLKTMESTIRKKIGVILKPKNILSYLNNFTVMKKYNLNIYKNADERAIKEINKILQ